MNTFDTARQLRGASGSRVPMQTGQSFSDKIPKGYKLGQVQQFTPEQMELFSQLFGHVSPQSFLSRLAGGDESMFSELEEPAMRQFGELQGQLASRFSGMGMGARRGSGFNISANQATSDFAKDLQAQRLGLRRQALQDLMGISGELLGQRPTERFLAQKPQKEPGFLQSLGTGLGSGVGKAAGSFLGGLF